MITAYSFQQIYLLKGRQSLFSVEPRQAHCVCLTQPNLNSTLSLSLLISFSIVNERMVICVLRRKKKTPLRFC